MSSLTLGSVVLVAAIPHPAGVPPLYAAGIARGIRLHGDRLRPAEEAKTVLVRDGEVLVSDGPFAETKEIICGYDMLECDSLEEAVQVASAHPVARFGKIEVRAVWP